MVSEVVYQWFGGITMAVSYTHLRFRSFACSSFCSCQLSLESEGVDSVVF